MTAPTNHQISDFPTPRYSNDPQDGNDNPLCEKKNFTYEPEVSMCNQCVVNCNDRITGDEEERLSVCCGVPTSFPDSDLCPQCKEHTDFLTEAEFDNA